MLFELNLHPLPFSLIKTGKKDVEMRLNTPERKKMKVGDIIRFTNRESDEKLEVIMTKIVNFPTFIELYNYYPSSRLGSSNYLDMNQYYKDEDIINNGVIAIEIKLINNKGD